jgi:hypothetical protein
MPGLNHSEPASLVGADSQALMSDCPRIVREIVTELVHLAASTAPQSRAGKLDAHCFGANNSEIPFYDLFDSFWYRYCFGQVPSRPHPVLFPSIKRSSSS